MPFFFGNVGSRQSFTLTFQLQLLFMLWAPVCWCTESSSLHWVCSDPGLILLHFWLDIATIMQTIKRPLAWHLRVPSFSSCRVPTAALKPMSRYTVNMIPEQKPFWHLKTKYMISSGLQWHCITQSYTIHNPFQVLKEFIAFYCSTSRGHYAI